MIHVAYRLGGGDGFYAKMLGVSMLSMFENTKEKVTVHVMHNDTLTPDNRDKFCYIAEQYNQQIEFHNVEEIAGDSIKRINEAYQTPLSTLKRFANASWYMFITPEVFPNLDKIIFFGTDIIINLDIAELWAYDVKEHGLAAIPETLSGLSPKQLPLVWDGYVKFEHYFNSDVLLIRPNFFTKNFKRILEGCRFIGEHKKVYRFVDQDVLNYLFAETYLKLPRKFNGTVRLLRKIPNFIIGKEIYHFAGHPKPALYTADVFNKLYLEYFLKTPYANADMFGNLDKAFRKQYDRLKVEFLRYTNLLARRERVFLIDKNSAEKMRQLFAIKDDESIIEADDSAAMEKFWETSNELKGKKLIYILGNDFAAIEQELRKRNFVSGEDFVNALIFLSEKDGGRWLVYDSRAMLREL